MVDAVPKNARTFQLVKAGDGFDLQPHVRSLPPLKSTEVLVKVAAMSLNYRDWLIRTGSNAGRKDGLVPLSDAAGTIIDLGREARVWQVGDHVMTIFFPGWHGGRFRSAYLQNALGGGHQDGVLSEYFVADEGDLVAAPAHLSPEEAATLPCAGVTAWHALVDRGRLCPNDTVLIQGTGGVAIFALQLAVAHGARAIVLSSSDAKLARAAHLGAWQTINYKERTHWDQDVLDLTDGAGVDHILELGGCGTFSRSLQAVAAGGHIAQIGLLTGSGPASPLSPLQFKNADIHGICVGSREHQRQLSHFFEKHDIHPVVDMIYPVKEIDGAYQRFSEAMHIGKIVLKGE